MNEWVVIGVIISLVTLYSGIYKLVSKPIHDLTVTLTQTNTKLETLAANDQVQTERLNKHDDKIGKLQLDQASLEKDVKFIKDRVN